MKKEDWFKYRGYPHIANSVPPSKRGTTEKYVSNFSKIKTHIFLPIISKEIIQRRFKESEIEGVSKRSHKIYKNGEFKSSKKIRTIMYASHMDAHIYAYYCKEIIQPKYEELLKSDKELDKCVIAYRKVPTLDGKTNKCNIHFAKEVFDEIKKRKNCVALLLDVENFFPSLNHTQLKRIWTEVIGHKSLPRDHYNIFKSVTNYSFVNLKDFKTQNGAFDEKLLHQIRENGKHAYFNTVKEFIESDIKIYKNPTKGVGIPQGLPISALLANMYMYNFDKEICESWVKTKNVFYRRYSDDMIFLCNESEIEALRSFVDEAIEKLKIKIAHDKTEVIYFKETENNDKFVLNSIAKNKNNEFVKTPLTYLGFEFYGDKTFIKTKNLGAFYREMKDTVRRKGKRVDYLNNKNLADEDILFKRKIYRLYSYHGIKTRELHLSNGRKKDYRGNFIRYVHKSSEILEAPEMRRQMRNHWKILQKTLKKYNFKNVN